MTRARRMPRWLLTALLLSLLGHGLWSVGLWWAIDRWTIPVEWTRTTTPAEVMLVDLTEPANEIRPEQARFLGTKDNTTSQETVAATTRTKRSATHEKPTTNPPPLTKGGRGGFPSKSTSSPPTADSTDTLPSPRTPRRLPATAVTEQLRGGASDLPEDYFPNYRRGAHTYVNVLRYPGIDYFVELKRTLKVAWNPRRALSDALVAGRHRIEVVIGTAVSAHGDLEECFVLKGSGLAAYDQEALRAFRASFPFFAPPAKLLTLDGTNDTTLHMSWAFIAFL